MSSDSYRSDIRPEYRDVIRYHAQEKEKVCRLGKINRTELRAAALDNKISFSPEN